MEFDAKQCLFFNVSQDEESNTMLGGVDFKEDGKVWKENRRENEKGCCLVRREGDENFWWGPSIFHLGPPKTCLSKMERK